MASEPIELTVATSVNEDALTVIAEFARAVAGMVSVFNAVAGMVSVFNQASRALASATRAVKQYQRRAMPNAVPLIASPWRKRYERRHYGRELTRGERDTRWRLMWGGLA